jgi:hypothetical protein
MIAKIDLRPVAMQIATTMQNENLCTPHEYGSQHSVCDAILRSVQKLGTDAIEQLLRTQ